MKQQIIQGYEVLSDGRTVWVNAPTGEAVARFSWMGIDVHRRLEDQRIKGQCLDCRPGPLGKSDWGIFKTLMLQHYQLTVPDRHCPRGLK